MVYTAETTTPPTSNIEPTVTSSYCTCAECMMGYGYTTTTSECQPLWDTTTSSYQQQHYQNPAATMAGATPPPSPLVTTPACAECAYYGYLECQQTTTSSWGHFTPPPPPAALTVTPPPSPQPAPTLLTTPVLLSIRFKRQARQCVSYTYEFSVGTYVLVDGDRGQDIGIVQSVNGACPRDPSSYRKVHRCATQDEITQLFYQRQHEAEGVALCMQRVHECRLTSAMQIEDAEYQFDTTKVTIYFRILNKKEGVDFRHLQRVLFKDFRCRVWLQNI
eukprot:PhF_6_TR35725/c0_g1_i1/m.51873